LLLCRDFHLSDIIAKDPDLPEIRVCQPPVLGPVAVFNLLLQLDSVVNPGITQAQFRELFANCDRCGLVMTRRTFQCHDCVPQEREFDIIDLTADD
jgi:hypothetical protein